MELDSIRAVLADGIIVIAVGGGGIPVVDVGDGEYRGVAAVIDKDAACGLLASQIGADLFLIATAVPKVALNFGRPDQRWIDHMSLAEARSALAEGTHFAKGSMAPKMEAIIRYLEAGGRRALVTSPDCIGRALAGQDRKRVRARTRPVRRVVLSNSRAPCSGVICSRSQRGVGAPGAGPCARLSLRRPCLGLFHGDLVDMRQSFSPRCALNGSNGNVLDLTLCFLELLLQVPDFGGLQACRFLK